MDTYNVQPDPGQPSMVPTDLRTKLLDARLRPNGKTISPDYAKTLATRAGDINVLRSTPTRDVGLTL